MKKENTQKLRTYQTISVVAILLGVITLIYMITVEDEPGALPLFLIVAGTTCFFIIRAKIKKQLH